jgi:hypothetical protein
MICEGSTGGFFVGSEIMTYSIKFVRSVTQISCIMKKDKTFVDKILFEASIPLLLMPKKDIDLFKEEPIEFIWNEK